MKTLILEIDEQQLDIIRTALPLTTDITVEDIVCRNELASMLDDLEVSDDSYIHALCR